MEQYIEFDGIKTTDFDVVVSGEGAFNAPERDVEMITIPGRNGELAIDRGRFQNIEVTYPAYNYKETYAEFAADLAGLRNALASRRGYKRLTDTFNPDEFRLAVFKSGLDYSPVMYNTAAEFDLVFDCKPQRFLVSGETQVDISSAAAQSFSGNPITFFNATGTSISSFESTVPPYQPSGAGSPTSYSEIRALTQGATLYNGTTAQTWTVTTALYGVKVNHKSQTLTRTHDGHIFTGTENISAYFIGPGKVGYFYCTMSGVGISSPSGNEAFCSRFKPVVYSSPTDLNNGEITHNGTNIYWRMDGVNSVADMKTQMSSWNSASEPMVYVAKRSSGVSVAGSVPALSFVANNAYTIESVLINSPGVYQQWGTVDLTINGPVNLINPTEFEARPLLSVTGTGTVTVGDVTITVGGNGSQMFIDCDIAEAWSISGGAMVNRNGDVSMNSTDFPSLPAGANVITFSAGITQVLVTPRWWRV